MINRSNKYNKQINLTVGLRRMYEICSNRNNFESGCDTILKIYTTCALDIMDAVSDSGNSYDLSAMLAILDNIGLYLFYLPDILLVSSVLVELANLDQDSTLENLTQGQKNWLNKKF